MFIKTLPEAQEAVAAVADFFDRFNRTLGTPKTNGLIPARHTTETESLKVNVPETMTERVMAILKDAGVSGLTPSELVEKYQMLGWPKPEGKLYTVLFSRIHYLAKKGRLWKNAGKYAVPGSGSGAKI